MSVTVPPAIDESNVVYNPKTIVDRWVVLECPVSGIPIPEVGGFFHSVLYQEIHS